MFDKLILLIRGDTRWHSRKSRKPHIVGECGKKTALELVVLYLRRVKRRIDRWSGHPEGGTRHIRSPIRCNGVLHEFGQSFFSRFDLGAVLMRLRGPECGSRRRFPFSLAARGHHRVTGERQQVGALWEDPRERPPEYPSGLACPMLCYPARGPANLRRRSDFLSLISIRALNGRPRVSIMVWSGLNKVVVIGC